MLQNELNSDMARFTTHVQACYQPDSLQDRFDVDGKTRHINIQLFCSNVACFLLPVLPYLKKSLFSFFSLGAPIISVMVSSGIAFQHYGPHNM